MAENKLTLGITADYLPDWTVLYAIREILQNAQDVKSKVEISWENGVATIRDYGCGFQPIGLLLGKTTKANDADKAGKNGEGLKIGAMVLLRNNRSIVAESLGKKFVFTMESSFVGEKVLTVTMYDSPSIGKGTKVTFDCTEAELAEAKGLFLAFAPQPKFTKQILDKSGAIYVMGIYANKLTTALGYNITNKACLNRDRNIIDQSLAKNEIVSLLENCKSRSVIARIIRSVSGSDSNILEAQSPIYTDHKRMWKQEFHRFWGKKACLKMGNVQLAVYNGFQPVDLPWGLRRTLELCGVPTADSAVRVSASRKAKISPTATQRKNLATARKILSNIFVVGQDVEEYTVRICKLGGGTNGECEGQKIRIDIDRLNTLEDTLSTLFHELCHLVHHNSDCTSTFEADLTKYGGKLALALLERGNSATRPNRGKKGVGISSRPPTPVGGNDSPDEPERGEKDGSGDAPEPVYASREPNQWESQVKTAVHDSLTGLIGDGIGDIDANILYARVKDQCDRYGINAPSWAKYVELAREQQVRFADYNRAMLPKRVSL